MNIRKNLEKTALTLATASMLTGLVGAMHQSNQYDLKKYELHLTQAEAQFDPRLQKINNNVLNYAFLSIGGIFLGAGAIVSQYLSHNKYQTKKD